MSNFLPIASIGLAFPISHNYANLWSNPSTLSTTFLVNGVLLILFIGYFELELCKRRVSWDSEYVYSREGHK